jgi:hypothetical protein
LAGWGTLKSKSLKTLKALTLSQPNKKSVNNFTAVRQPNGILIKKEAFMPQTKTKTPKINPIHDAWVKSLPEVEYPPEVVERWEKESEAMEVQLATGELKPKTAAELAAELGIKLG